MCKKVEEFETCEIGRKFCRTIKNSLIVGHVDWKCYPVMLDILLGSKLVSLKFSFEFGDDFFSPLLDCRVILSSAYLAHVRLEKGLLYPKA